MVHRSTIENTSARSGWTKKTIAGMAAAAVTSMPFITACAPKKVSAEPVPASAPAVPGTETSATPTAKERTPEQIETDAYEKLTGDEFYALPRDAQLRVVFRKYKEVADTYIYLADYLSREFNGTQIGNYNPLTNPTDKFSNGAQIVGQNIFTEQITIAQEPEGKDSNQTYDPINVHTAQQLLSGVFYDMKVGDRGEFASMMLEDINAPGATAKQLDQENLNGIVIIDTSPLKKGKDTEGNTIEYKDITISSSGYSYTIRYIYYEFTDETGVLRSIWLQDTVKYHDSKNPPEGL